MFHQGVLQLNIILRSSLVFSLKTMLTWRKESSTRRSIKMLSIQLIWISASSTSSRSLDMSSRPWDGFLNWLREWNRPPVKFTRDLVLGIALGFGFSLSSASLALYWQQTRRRKALTRTSPRPIELRSDEVVQGVVGLIGNTPLVRINSLSDALGVEILVSFPTHGDLGSALMT
jgi:hypothetical protein